MEMLEIYNDRFEKTGESVSRKEAHAKGVLHKTVHVWIVDPEKGVLVQQRSFKKRIQPGKWDVACAGHVSFGETPREAAVKEVKEELGLDIDSEELIYLTTLEKRYVKDDIDDHEIYDVFLVVMNVDNGKIDYDSHEVNSVSFIERDLFFTIAEKDENFIYNSKEYPLVEKVLLQML